MNTLVVSPSISPIIPEYYQAVRDLDILVVDDSDGRIPRDPHALPHIQYFLRDDILRYIPKDSEYLFPQHNPSCKNFGLYYAWKEGYERIILLDDDCDTSVNPDFLDQIPVGKEVLAHGANAPHGWWNPMVQMGKPDFFSRGFPYEYRGHGVSHTKVGVPVRPKFNEGLWWGTPDINGADKIGHEPEVYETIDRVPFPAYVAPRPGDIIPVSIMNVQLTRDLIPAFYQPPDFDVAPGWKIRRHDDVWSAGILQMLMGCREDIYTVGCPYIYHRKRGDLIKEIKSENCTNLIQPYLFELLRRAVQFVHVDTYSEMARQLAYHARALMTTSMGDTGVFGHILHNYLTRVDAWTYLFHE